MENRERKIELIENGVHNKYRNIKYKAYKNNKLYFNVVDEETGVIKKQINDNVFIENGIDSYDLKLLRQLSKARKEQRAKIRNHLYFWLAQKYTIFFCTFTINDEKRAKMSSQKNYINNFKKHCIRCINNLGACDYIINVDYGDKYDREHFHALIAFDNFDEILATPKKGKKRRNQYVFINDNYNLGYNTYIKCGINVKDMDKLSSYLDKLVLHSIKVKQSYVATKKGSKYQEFAKVANAIDKYGTNGIELNNYNYVAKELGFESFDHDDFINTDEILAEACSFRYFNSKKKL